MSTRDIEILPARQPDGSKWVTEQIPSLRPLQTKDGVTIQGRGYAYRLAAGVTVRACGSQWTLEQDAWLDSRSYLPRGTQLQLATASDPDKG